MICPIVSLNQTHIILQFVGNETIVLTEVLNLYPNDNMLMVKIMTNLYEDIAYGEVQILPTIALEKLEVTGQVASSASSEINTIMLNIIPRDIEIGTDCDVRIVMPNKLFDRQDGQRDCKVTVSGKEYNGCRFDVDEDGLQSVVFEK